MRIRSVKPEWLEDELLAAEPDAVRVLSVGLILMADDYGHARANPAFVRSSVWPYRDPPESLQTVSERLRRLAEITFIRLYQVAGQQYYEICNWSKHQKVSHPGKPMVPGPLESSGESPESVAPDLDPPPSPGPDPDQEGGTRGDALPPALEDQAPEYLSYAKLWQKGTGAIFDAASARRDLEALARLCKAADPKNPVAVAIRVIAAYAHHCEARGKRPNLSFLVKDFDQHANPPRGAGPVPPTPRDADYRAGCDNEKQVSDG